MPSRGNWIVVIISIYHPVELEYSGLAFGDSDHFRHICVCREIFTVIACGPRITFERRRGRESSACVPRAAKPFRFLVVYPFEAFKSIKIIIFPSERDAANSVIQPCGIFPGRT